MNFIKAIRFCIAKEDMAAVSTAVKESDILVLMRENCKN